MISVRINGDLDDRVAPQEMVRLIIDPVEDWASEENNNK